MEGSPPGSPGVADSTEAPFLQNDIAYKKESKGKRGTLSSEMNLIPDQELD